MVNGFFHTTLQGSGKNPEVPDVDHSTVQRWAIKLRPVLGKAFRRRKQPVGALFGWGAGEVITVGVKPRDHE